jgi:acetoin utilization deacetylase AcuC-like enzyme
MLPFKLVYHPGYDLNLGDHVFPARKYRLIHDQLLDEGFAEPMDFVEPRPASDEEILLVHERGWVQRLKTGTLTPSEILRLEIPYSKPMVDAFWLATGGTILAARNALADRVGFNIGGGFHHAFPDHGEGFCAIHDVAVAIRALQHERRIERALVLDCDVHHGNGTAAIFAGDRSVMTLSMHQFDNYPSEKPPSVIDIHLKDGVSTMSIWTVCVARSR